jgi:U3 small nucleolar RNA-associated protein 15
MKPAEFTGIQLKEFPRIQDRETSEARYWKSLSNVKEIAITGSPNTIHFNPATNNAYIVTASTKVTLIDCYSDRVQRSYSRFTDDAFSGRFRHDGKLIAAGEKTGVVKVFDTQSKSLLRQMRHHNAATRCVRWAADGVHLVSGSDDRHLIRWDIATEEIVWSKTNHHKDYIRALDCHPTSNSLFVSGSYDHVVSFWDQRTDTPIWSIQQGHPVEYCLFAPSGNILATVGGNEVKLWDVISGGRLIHTFNNHQKNISTLCFDTHASRLLSGGLDGHIKIYNLALLEVSHGMKFTSPVYSLALSADSKKLVIGFVDGELMIRNNKRTTTTVTSSSSSTLSGTTTELAAILKPELSITDIIDRNLSQARHYKGVISTATSSTGGGAIIAEHERSLYLQPYEKFLKKFRYQKALDAALETKDPVIVITVLEELSRRHGLTIALSGRDETTLEPILSFTVKYISHMRYADIVVPVAHKIIDMYDSILGQSTRIDELFLSLHKHVIQELDFQKDAQRVMGAIDCIINLATMPKQRRKISLDEEWIKDEKEMKELLLAANATATKSTTTTSSSALEEVTETNGSIIDSIAETTTTTTVETKDKTKTTSKKSKKRDISKI